MSLLDWVIVAVFLLGITVFGMGFSGRNTSLGEYFLAGRSLPSWLVTLSMVGASISAGTFVGAPQFAYESNLTFLMLGVAGVVGGILTARIFVPAFYNANTVTVYGLLGTRYGGSASFAASVVFLVGQLLTSGARLYIAAIALSVILFNDIATPNLLASIILLGVLATIYTVAGGIRALVYVDALMIVIVLVSGLVCIVALVVAIPATPPEIITALTSSPGGNKLTLVKAGFSLTEPYNLTGTLIGFTFFKIAQYGTDHEFTQRVFVCRSVKKAARALVMAQLVSLPIVGVFMAIGLLLYVFYARPDIMGVFAPTDTLTDSRQVFPQYIYRHFPSGLLGVTAVGLLAAAHCGFNSAINAMASSVVSDIFAPIGRWLGVKPATLSNLNGSRVVAALIGLTQTAFAVAAVYMHQAGGQNLVDFALGIMSYGYAGLLGVFFCAVYTRRGSAASVIAALVAGAVAVYLLQPQVIKKWTAAVLGQPFTLAWTWWVAVGAAVSFAVCLIGRTSLAAPESQCEHSAELRAPPDPATRGAANARKAEIHSPG